MNANLLLGGMLVGGLAVAGGAMFWNGDFSRETAELSLNDTVIESPVTTGTADQAIGENAQEIAAAPNVLRGGDAFSSAGEGNFIAAPVAETTD